MNRISTSQFYSRSLTQMTGLNVQADKLQTQISTTKKLAVASDDAAGFTRLASLKRGASNDKAAGANIDLAQGILAQSEAALGSITDQLQRAKELGVQANGGTLSADQRAIIASQIDGIIQDVTALANQKDIRGIAMFGGGGDAAFAVGAGGAISYVGGTRTGSIPTGNDTDVQVTEDGTPMQAVFDTLAALSAAVKSGDGIGAANDQVTGALDTVSAMRSSVGARAMRLDIEMERLDEVALGREEARSAIEDTDVTAAITELQKTLTILSATQASFTKLTSLSLFDQLR
ncbi:flagellar biosynthesis protein FlgL [Sphingomonas spermidinifaciens]|uniref:Flagellin n=1 Tax=Sphingomonas spermidinifaciens TaxID=1141889 RepID=A0A2A4AZX5_9SPHN|nr:flagellin [Sphingomonas spermidinifaciens]PCD02493.1 flagellar biosynthesis protein FlgL [Sphingomonas spermidinifaciens]